MVAAPRLQRRENLYRPQLDGEQFPDLLKVAAIYGPNASGKSNLIKAFRAVREIASRVPSAHPTPLPFQPFRFDASLARSPSKFEVNFINGNQRYQFCLAATSERIHEEKLIVFVKGKETLLYHRVNQSGHDEYTLGKALEGGAEVHDVWRKLTSAQQLFMSQAVANSNSDLQQLRVPFRWLTHNMFATQATVLRGLATATQNVAQDRPEVRSALLEFIRDLDIPISRLTFKQKGEARKNAEVAADLDSLSRRLVEPRHDVLTLFTHESELGEADFEFEDESTGTQGLIGFYLLWMVLQADGAAERNVIVLDEFDTSLHPKIVHELLRRYIAKAVTSQLIFTTHDTHLMDTKLLRRDQFWLTERDSNGATQLRSVHDFEGREGEDVEKRYYEGRYRSLPIVKSE